MTIELRNKKEKKVAVIGAGPAGITAAYELAKAGIEVDIFEASSSVGGLAKTLRLWNQKVDLGPHRFFSKDSRVNDLYLEVIQDEYRIVNRLTRILYKNKFYSYPLKLFNALKNLGPAETILCLSSYLKEKMLLTKMEESFKSWVINKFGKRLFEIFFKTYNEKLWGISCEKIDVDFAAQRIKTLSLAEAVKNSIYKINGSIPETLLSQFIYPKGGTGMLYERMADFINKTTGNIYFQQPVNSVLIKDNKAVGIELLSGEVKFYAYVISTMPINMLVSKLPGVPETIKSAAEKLKFRNTIIVYLNILSPNLFADNWIYINSKDLRMGRITNFRNWVPELYGNETSTILALEYWCYDEDAIWTEKDKTLIELATEELRQTGLIKDAPVKEGYVHRIHRCYPVYKKGYKEILNPIQNYLNSIDGLTVIGRYGSFKYNNQDHSILMGILAAENIIKKSKHNMWGINTDYKVYQESLLISKTSFVKR